MSRKQKRLIYIFAAFTVLAFFLIADPMNLAVIDQNEQVVGAFTKGDFLVLFSIFGTTVTAVMFFSTGRWRTRK